MELGFKSCIIIIVGYFFYRPVVHGSPSSKQAEIPLLDLFTIIICITCIIIRACLVLFSKMASKPFFHGKNKFPLNCAFPFRARKKDDVTFCHIKRERADGEREGRGRVRKQGNQSC